MTSEMLTDFIIFPYLAMAQQLAAIDTDESVRQDASVATAGIAYLRLIGDRVREKRDERGLSQKALGALAGINKETVNRIELGGGAGMATLMKVADALEMRYSFVFSDESDLTRPSVDQESGTSVTGGSPTDEQRAEVPPAVQREIDQLRVALASIETTAEGIAAAARAARRAEGGRAASTKPGRRRSRRASG